MSIGKQQATSKKWLYISFLLLVVVIAGNIWLYIYSANLEKTKAELISQKDEISNEVDKLNNDSKIQVYNLISKNESKIENMKKMSTLRNIIGEIWNITSKYWIIFDTFAYSNWVINSSVYTESTVRAGGVSWKPYEKIVSFLGEYADRWTIDSTKNSIKDDILKNKWGIKFDVDFINSFSGDEKISFNLKLSLKD